MLFILTPLLLRLINIVSDVVMLIDCKIGYEYARRVSGFYLFVVQHGATSGVVSYALQDQHLKCADPPGDPAAVSRGCGT